MSTSPEGKSNNQEPELKIIGFEMEPEELLPAMGINPDEFKILAYTPPERRGEVTVIDADEFEAASKDPLVQATLRAAQEYVEKLDQEGRNL
jgi:hypothetical protein